MHILKKITTRTTGCQNEKCKSAKRAGRHVHAVAFVTGGSLVLPSYHFSSVESAEREIKRMFASAIVITTDAQLFEARAKKIAHILPNGWVDPTRR